MLRLDDPQASESVMRPGVAPFQRPEVLSFIRVLRTLTARKACHCAACALGASDAA